MRPSIRQITLASSLLFSSMPASAAEELEMLISGDSATDTLELQTGESAKLVYAQFGADNDDNARDDRSPWNPLGVKFAVTIRGKTLLLGASDAKDSNKSGTEIGNLAPLEIPGPATITIDWSAGNISLTKVATFKVTRVGTASPPAEVPQEAGSNFDVILEQSSDLINWTPANPGSYSGTETKRFFRTRIVKKP
jgi:hypothetical protein